ncbi:MAG: hypothetical protein AB7V14_02200 [Kiritimatiellia bacterium]
MKKLIGMVALFALGFAVASASAQDLAPAEESVAAPVEAAVEAIAAPVAEAAAPVVAAAVEITVKGEVSVVNGADGALLAIYVNPTEGHGYKIDIVNGEGKTLADKDGKTVEAVGVDANRLFTVKTIAVVE